MMILTYTWTFCRNCSIQIESFLTGKNCWVIFVNICNLSFCCYMILVKMRLSCSFKTKKNTHKKTIKKICNFYFYCCDEHGTFVYTCKAHPFISTRAEGMWFQCRCAKRDPSEVCDFCIQVKYMLNFRAYKICLKKIPEKFQQI